MIFTVFKKEFIDTLRDRRTIIMMIVIPILIFPLIMTVVMKASTSFSEKSMEKTVQIGLFSDDESGQFRSELEAMGQMGGKQKLFDTKDTNQIKKWISQDRLDFGFYIPSNYSKLEDVKEQAQVKVFYDLTNMGSQERAEAYINLIEQKVKQQRYKALNVKEEMLQPVKVSYINVASDKETLGKLAGGFLPYMFIAFGFMGCMYPAIDLFTGEKERGTLETLLTTPVARWKILVGKMLVVVLSGLLAASFTMFGLFLSIEVFDVIKEPKIIEIIHSLLTVKFITTFYLILLPLIIFFAGVMIPIAVYAKTFKEAQSIIAPMNAIIVLPAMVGFIPGIELDVKTACIPIINVVLATKELIAGTLEIGLLLQSFGIMVLVASVMVMVSLKRFGKETNLVS